MKTLMVPQTPISRRLPSMKPSGQIPNGSRPLSRRDRPLKMMIFNRLWSLGRPLVSSWYDLTKQLTFPCPLATPIELNNTSPPLRGSR